MSNRSHVWNHWFAPNRSPLSEDNISTPVLRAQRFTVRKNGFVVASSVRSGSPRPAIFGRMRRRGPRQEALQLTMVQQKPVCCPGTVDIRGPLFQHVQNRGSLASRTPKIRNFFFALASVKTMSFGGPACFNVFSCGFASAASEAGGAKASVGLAGLFSRSKAASGTS